VFHEIHYHCGVYVFISIRESPEFDSKFALMATSLLAQFGFTG